MTNESESALSVLYASITGDANLVHDGAQLLRNLGIDSVGDVLSLLATSWTDYRRGEIADTASPFEHLRQPTPNELRTQIVQKVPEVPFILNGTTYDPQDISRFNGIELHFVIGTDSNSLLVLDDRNALADWLQVEYLDRTVRAAAPAAPPVSRFWDDTNLVEYAITLNKNRGYRNLKNLAFFWPSGQTWNDRISSISMYGTGVAQLHEHVDYTGQTFTRVLPNGAPYGEDRDLNMYGWNDRASAIGTW